MTERKTGQKIGTLCTDHGGEFTSNEFVEYCRQQGIQRQLTHALTPEQNGVAERHNKTIIERARSMISHCKLLGYLWSEH
jgi:transposase InsO family protein